MRDKDDLREMGKPEKSEGSSLLSTHWRCSDCGAAQVFAEPSQPIECECGGLWFETESAVLLH